MLWPLVLGVKSISDTPVPVIDRVGLGPKLWPVIVTLKFGWLAAGDVADDWPASHGAGETLLTVAAG
jgi:hypothetical protein